jgi:integrase
MAKRPLTPSGVGQMLAKRGKAAGVDVRAHAFRRMHAGEWMKRGGSETGLMTNSGWKSTAMISRYTKDTKESNAQR